MLQKRKIFWQFQVTFYMLGTYVMYLDIGKDDDYYYDDGQSSDEDTMSHLQIPHCRHYEITKDSQKYGQHPCKNCEKVHF